MVVNSEVVARAHLENRGAPVATPDSTHLHHQVREHALASEDPLRVVAEGPVNRDVLRALVEANTQTRDAAGGVIESTALRTSGLANIDRLADIQRGEVADLNRLAADPTVIRSLESVIGQNVDLNTLYRGLSPAKQRDYREALLRDPNTKRKISEMLQQRGSPDKLLADELEALRIEGDRLTQERTRLTTERATKSTDLANNQNELREYQTRVDSSTTPPTIVEGVFTQELARLQSAAEPLRQDVDILRSQVDKLQEDIQHARNSKVSLLGHPSVDTSTPAGVSKTSGLDVEITDLENRLTARKTQLRNRTDELQQHEQRINSINARKTALEDAVASAKTRIAEIDSRLGEISPEYAQNQSRLHTAETSRGQRETEFIASLETILGEAVASTINMDMDKLVAQQVQNETEARNNARSAQERDLREGVMSMFRNHAGEIDWATFDTGWSNLLLHGTDALLEAHLHAHPVAGLTMDQLRNNSDLYNSIIGDLNTKMGRLRMSRPRNGALRTRLLGPRPLTEMEVRSVVDRMGGDYFDTMLNSNAALKAQIEKAAGQGSLEGHKFSQLLRKMPLKTIGVMLMLIFGSSMFGLAKM